MARFLDVVYIQDASGNLSGDGRYVWLLAWTSGRMYVFVLYLVLNPFPLGYCGAVIHIRVRTRRKGAPTDER